MEKKKELYELLLSQQKTFDMKKILFSFLLAVGCWLLVVVRVNALTPTPSIKPTISSSPTQMVNSEAINELKDRIASRVAQLKLVERRGIIGAVTDLSDTQLTLSDLQNNTRFIDVDELTKFSSPSAKGSFGISDLSKGTKLGVLGLYNKQSRRILARFIDVLSLPVSFHGAISEIDGKNYTLTVVTENNEQKTVDVENTTRTLAYTKESGLVRAGFSKIKEQENIIVIGFTDIKNKNRIIASRILLFPEIPKNPKITIPEKPLTPQETTVPSTGSGKKLMPIIR